MSPVPYQTKTQLILPVKGGVLVWDGHDYQSHHRRFDYTRGAFLRLGIKTNSQRYAYDFVVVDDQGLMHRAEQSAGDEWYPGKSDTNEAYYGFSVSIHAAGTGRVAAIHDGEPDNRSFNQAELATRETARGGNYVVVDHLNGEFSWFGHLKQGSISVKIGQQVKQGEVIARMGASGDSLFPQLAALPFSLSPWVCTSETDGFAPRCRRSSPARCPTSSLSFSGKTTPEKRRLHVLSLAHPVLVANF